MSAQIKSVRVEAGEKRAKAFYRAGECEGQL